MEKKIVQENEKEKGGDETLSRGAREPSTHTHGLYISGPAGVGNDSTTPNSTTGDM
jgi:hypothetical protein